ncbi:hypothetical protein [Shimia ponticola]|uniref:hypothetical protein n=1 Tax=Shimia ponticola TaxID=2582893 RepID=UPI0011BFB76E|nr:hypothetical protein [Shimia ponticola]
MDRKPRPHVAVNPDLGQLPRHAVDAPEGWDVDVQGPYRAPVDWDALVAQYRAAAPSPRSQRPAPRRIEVLGVKEVLEWAFHRERVQAYHFDDDHLTRGESPIAALIRRGELGGVRIDGGGSSEPCDAALSVAFAVAQSCLPSMVGLVIEHARSATVPDAMVGACPYFVPVAVHSNQHGVRAKVTRGTDWSWQITRGGRRKVTHDFCEVTVVNTPAQIASARRRYLNWWGQLQGLQPVIKALDLPYIKVSDRLPPRNPWENHGVEKSF